LNLRKKAEWAAMRAATGLSESMPCQESSLSFGKLGATKMMCPPALMEQEARFLAALERVSKVQIQNGLLVLLDVEGVAVFKASRKEK